MYVTICCSFEHGRKGLCAAQIQECMLELGIRTSYYKANRARKQAEKMCKGSAVESYQNMYSYMHMLKEANPGTYTSIVKESDDKFKYVFWCLGAWIRALPHLKKV